MSVKRINGIQLEQMLRNGLANLRLQEDEINRLNVFPVPDGDTGTNMVKTLEHGLELAESSTEVNVFTKSLSAGMLLGARGNSGVILSQFFYGFSQALARSALIGPGELRGALVRGYRIAYSSVIMPVEGTILTVAREGIEHIRAQITRATPVEVILAAYVAEMRKTLAQTPEMLPVLKEAGVVDSGAAGFIAVFAGMVKYLRGEVLEDRAPEKKSAAKAMDLRLFDENSEFIDGYCMEFILQLMNGSDYRQDFRLKTYIASLQRLGESIVCVQDGKRVKVHIHTKAPAPIITLSQRFGEFLTFKLENMQVQHNERDREIAKPAHKALSVAAVANGEGMRSLFAGLGADCVLDGGPTMNTSAQEFVSALASVDADTVVILPNDKNTLLAAKQAVELSGSENVVVLPTRSMVEGYFALAMDVPDNEDTFYRIRQMQLGMKNVDTIAVSRAVRDSSFRGLSFREGDCIAFCNGEPAAAGGDWTSVILEALQSLEDMEDREACVIFRGAGAEAQDEDAIVERIGAAWPELEVSFLDGGQSIYPWLLGIT